MTNPDHTGETKASDDLVGQDELGLFELGRSFLEEYERYVREGAFPNFVCADSPVEIVVHLINERDDLRAQLAAAEADLKRSIARDSGGYAPDGKTWKQAVMDEAERRGRAEAQLEIARKALELAEDVLSRAPMSTMIWPNGTHPQSGITQIREALRSLKPDGGGK